MATLMKMKRLSFLITIMLRCACVFAETFTGSGTCEAAVSLGAEAKRSGRIIDITHAYREDLPIGGSAEGLGADFWWLVSSMKNGSFSNISAFKLGSHTGTHVDSPGHFFSEYLDAGYDVDSLDLHVLNGIESSQVQL